MIDKEGWLSDARVINVLKTGVMEFGLVEHFKLIWLKLEWEGKCDEWGSAECTRLCEMWMKQISPLLEAFICKHANGTPPATHRPVGQG